MNEWNKKPLNIQGLYSNTTPCNVRGPKDQDECLNSSDTVGGLNFIQFFCFQMYDTKGVCVQFKMYIHWAKNWSRAVYKNKSHQTLNLVVIHAELVTMQFFQFWGKYIYLFIYLTMWQVFLILVNKFHRLLFLIYI